MRRLLMIAMTLLVIAGTATAQDRAREITVTGEGVVEAAPDMAMIRLGVTTEAKGARESIDENSKAMSGVLERLTSLGIEARDVQTGNFSVQPRFARYDGGPAGRPQIEAFITNNQVMVRVRDLSKLGEVLDAVARDGANTFDSLQFGLQEPGPYRDDARKLAVEDAQRKAALYAEAAGVPLGQLMRIDEHGDVGQPRPMDMAMARMEMEESVPIAAGELSVTSRVNLVYSIGE